MPELEEELDEERERRLRARRLRRLRLSRIDLVPAGANPEANISFFKRKAETMSKQADDLRARIAKAERQTKIDKTEGATAKATARMAEAARREELTAAEVDWASELEQAANDLVMKTMGTKNALTREQAKVEIVKARPDLRAKIDADLHPIAKAPPHPGAEFLRKRREAAGMSQLQLAKAAGLNSQQLVSALEHGAHPSFETFSKAAQALGVTYADLVEVGLLRGEPKS